MFHRTEKGMSPALLLLFSCLGGLGAVQWIPQTQMKTTTQVCLKGNVTVGWDVITEQGEVIEDIKWLFTPIASNTPDLIATYIYRAFATYPPFGKRLNHLGNGVVVLSDVTPADVGSYRVEVITRQATGSFSTIHRDLIVSVIDPATYSSNNLTVRMDQQAAPDANGELHVQLTCGPLAWRGEPPVDVIWKTPSGAEQASSYYRNETFRLLLTNPIHSGIYTCRLASSAHDAMCLIDGDPVLREATLLVDAVDARLMLLEAKEQAHNRRLKEELEKANEQLEQYRSHVGNMTQQLQYMESELDSYRPRFQNLNQRLQYVDIELDNYRTYVGNLTQHLQYVESELDNCRCNSSEHSGFQAILQSNVAVNSSGHFEFDHVLYNHGGAYDNGTGEFTAQLDGSYFFAVTLTPRDLRQVDCALIADGSQVAYINLYNHVSHRDTSTFTMHAVVHLVKGDRVWVENRYHAYFDRYSTFSGFLIRPDR